MTTAFACATQAPADSAGDQPLNSEALGLPPFRRPFPRYPESGERIHEMFSALCSFGSICGHGNGKKCSGPGIHFETDDPVNAEHSLGEEARSKGTPTLIPEKASGEEPWCGRGS